MIVFALSRSTIIKKNMMEHMYPRALTHTPKQYTEISSSARAICKELQIFLLKVHSTTIITNNFHPSLTFENDEEEAHVL